MVKKKQNVSLLNNQGYYILKIPPIGGIFFVESPRIELGSKQAIQKLSTSLVLDLIFDLKLCQEPQL